MRAKRWQRLLFPKLRRDRRRPLVEKRVRATGGPRTAPNRGASSPVSLGLNNNSFAEDGGTAITVATLIRRR